MTALTGHQSRKHPTWTSLLDRNFGENVVILGIRRLPTDLNDSHESSSIQLRDDTDQSLSLGTIL